MFGPPFSPSEARGVLHGDPIEPVPLVWRVDGASRDIDAPAGVVFSRQISADSVEPTIPSRSRNLLSHDDRGPAGTDEAMKVRPQMPWIIGSSTFACRAERLAGAATGPKRSVVCPSGHSGCDGPQPAASEEMTLRVVSEVIGVHILDGSGVDVTGGNDADGDEVPQDRGSGRVDLVVVGGQLSTPFTIPKSANSLRQSGQTWV
jgi:hypothetical protein